MKNRLFKFLIILGSCVFAGLLLEGVLRIIRHNSVYIPDTETILSRRPNFRGKLTSFETQENLNGLSDAIPETPKQIGWDHTNNEGLRMSKDIGPKAKNEKRVLLLGDSFTEAEGVLEEDRFFSIAEKRLNALGSHWAVINAGIQNGSPGQYALQLRKYLSKFNPDFVITLISPNDLRDDLIIERKYGLERDIRGVPLKLQNSFWLTLLKNSYLLRTLHDRVPSLVQIFSRPTNPSIALIAWQKCLCQKNTDVVKILKEVTGKNLIGMRELSESTGAKFGVLVGQYSYIFPKEPHYWKRYSSPMPDLEYFGCHRDGKAPFNSLIDTFLKDHQIAFRNSLKSFWNEKQIHPKQKLFNFYDYHFSPAGHKLLAQELVELLKELNSTPTMTAVLESQ